MALLTGFRMLLIVVAVLYSFVFLLAGRFRFLADRHLEREGDMLADGDRAASVA